MADERVVIKIEVKSDDREIDRTRRKLERLANAKRRDTKTDRDRDRGLASRGRNQVRNMVDNERSISKVNRKWKKSFDDFDKMIKFAGTGLMKFLGMSAKMVAIELGAMGLALVGVHAAFVAGRLLMKAYHGMMKMVAGGAAGLAIALGTVAAALREQQSAMFAFAAKGQAKEFGSAVNQARVQIRALTMDADLAAVGVENLMAVYGEVSKTSRFTTGSANTLKGLMDFAAAGQDLKKGTEAAGQFLATLQDTKKSYSEVVSAGKKFSPQMKKALEEYEKKAGAKGKTKEELTKAITSGKLAELGGVEGQFAGVSGTLINTLKGQFNLLRGLFADFGQQFLGPVKKESKEVFDVIKNALFRLQGQIGEFGRSGFIDKISVVVQKMADWTVKMMREYLPQTMGIFGRIGDWWNRFVDGWNRVLDFLRPLIEGARVVESILKNAWLPIWDQLKEKSYEFNNQLQEYRPALEEFGTRFGELIAKIMEYGSEIRKIFMESLPFLNKVIKGFTDLIELFTSFLGKFTQLTSKLPGGLGSMGSVMMLIGLARGMKNTKGYFMPGSSQSGIREAANMNVNAGTVFVNGKPIASYGSTSTKGGTITKTATGGTVRTGGTPIPMGRGPYSSAVHGGGRSAGGGFASRGSGEKLSKEARSRIRSTYGGNVRQNAGPNGGHLITSGKYKGMEVLTQKVRGKNVEYLFGGRGTGKLNDSAKNLVGKDVRSGVITDPTQRMKRGSKIVDATGRIITRREQIARRIGEGQRAGSTAYIGDSRPKNFFDRFMGGGRNTGATGFIGRAADKYRNRLVANSNYLGPDGPPINPKTGKPFTPSSKAYKQWMLTSNRPYGPGTRGKLMTKWHNTQLYNNWFAQGSSLQGPREWRFANKGMDKTFGKTFRGISKLRTDIREMRSSRAGAAIFGDEKAGKKGFQNSATGTMGTMLALGMLSNYASPEAQGFLSAGSMVGMVNPLAGLAIGLGGTALTAKTEKGGAMAGAGAGAAIGTMIAPGFGTAAGAIIGAAIGGLMGRANRIKEEKKQARQIMEGVFNQIITSNLIGIQRDMMAQGFTGKSSLVARAGSMSKQIGGISDLQKQFGKDNAGFVNALYDRRADLGITMSAEERDKMLKQPAEAAKYTGQAVDKQLAMNKLTEIYSKRLNELTRMTGKTEQEVEKMAMEMGVNLYDSTVDFNTVLQKLGLNIAKTREQMRGLQLDLALGGLKDFEQQIQELDAPEILDEQARAFRDLYDSLENPADMKEKDFLNFVKDFMPNYFTTAGGGLQGLLSARSALGVGGTAFTRQEMVNGELVKDPFFGMEQIFTQTPAGMMFQDYLNKQIGTGTRQLGGDLNSILFGAGGESGQRFQIDTAAFETAMGTLSAEKQIALTSAIQDGRLFRDFNMETLSGDQISQALSAFGLSGTQLGLRAAAADDELNIALDKMPEDLRNTYQGIIDMFSNFFDKRDERPDWMTEEFIKLAYETMQKDTYSPRGKGIGDTTSSRLSQTLARHSSMDGMLTGKRTMTSSYRTYGLGSINSDHVTGRAYDLVGQNLGAYQRLAVANGGFAEFHGVNGTRHLHVVPGRGPFGEATPVAKQVMSAPMTQTSGSNVYITQNIQGGPNASATEVAKIAVREMKLALENERQRML